MKRLFIFLLLVFSLQFICSKDKNYINSNVGFFLKYPDNVFLVDRINRGNKEEKKLQLFIGTQKVKNLEDMPSGYDRANIIAERERLAKGDNSGVIDWPKGKELVKIDNRINGKSFCVLSRFVIDDIVFVKQTIFFIDKYVVFITLDATDFKEEIINNMSSFFNAREQDGIYEWKIDKNGDSMLNFYNTLKSGKGVGIAQEWFDTFDKIVQSIKITVSYFTPTINNLRFRSSPDLKGDFIRLLKKGERLELLEKGKEEVIQGDKGTWVKVITAQGEIGWCFDAYLKEVIKVDKN